MSYEIAGIMQLSRKQWLKIIGGLLTVISFARVAVLFLEAVAQVRDERLQDVELLELCQQGAARGSYKMRRACVDAQAERASPLMFKAVVRAVSNAYSEFADSVSTPAKLAVVALFVLSSAMPFASWVRALSPADEIHGDSHVVVLAHDPASTLGVNRSAWKRAVGAMAQRRVQFSPQDAEEQSFSVSIEDGHEKRE
jgi:hypothetical protein